MTENLSTQPNPLFRIRPISFILFLVFTFFTLKEAYHSFRNSSPTTINCSEVTDIDVSTWVSVEGCELRYTFSAHQYYEGLKSLKTPVVAWVPVFAESATDDDKAIFVLASGDDDVLSDVKEMEKHLQLSQTADPLLLESQNISGTRSMKFDTHGI